MGPEDEWMTTTEAMEALGVSRITLYRWIDQGRIRAEKPRAAVRWQQWRLSAEDVGALLRGEEPHSKAE
jgi:excisionase family DNA binding protein